VSQACPCCMERYEVPVGKKARCPACGEPLAAVASKPRTGSADPQTTSRRGVGWLAAGAVALVVVAGWLLVALGGREEAPRAAVAEPKKVVEAEAPEKLLVSAELAIVNRNMDQAKVFLESYLAAPTASQIDKAKLLLTELQEATSDERASAFLNTLSDRELSFLLPGRPLPDDAGQVETELKSISTPSLRELYEATLRRHHFGETARRTDIRRREAEAAARQEQRANEERAKRAKQQREQAAKAARERQEAIKRLLSDLMDERACARLFLPTSFSEICTLFP
jgi:hypothetical protein